MCFHVLKRFLTDDNVFSAQLAAVYLISDKQLVLLKRNAAKLCYVDLSFVFKIEVTAPFVLCEICHSIAEKTSFTRSKARPLFNDAADKSWKNFFKSGSS